MSLLEDKERLLKNDFRDSCRKVGGKLEETASELGCKIESGEFFLHLPKNTLYGNFKFETRDGKKIGVIFDERTIDII